MELDEISIRVGMPYADVVEIVEQNETLLIDKLPAFCNDNYKVIKNIATDEKIYVGLDNEREVVSVITYDLRVTVDTNKAEQMIDKMMR